MSHPGSRNYRNNQRSKRRKAKLRAERLERWRACCHNNLIKWDCHCSFGCDACDVHHECKVCHTKYRARDIQSLTHDDSTPPIQS